MPARSQAQRNYLAMRFGAAWMRKHHFDNPGPLPKHVKHDPPKEGHMAYIGFKKLEGQIAARGGVRNPGAVAASIGRAKYGKKKFQKAAATGRSMRNVKPMHSRKDRHVALAKYMRQHG